MFEGKVERFAQLTSEQLCRINSRWQWSAWVGMTEEDFLRQNITLELP